MTSILEEAKVIQQSKDGKDEKVFDALEWLAAMCSHVPNKGEQMVRYYGYHSNVSRGKRNIQRDSRLHAGIAILFCDSYTISTDCPCPIRCVVNGDNVIED